MSTCPFEAAKAAILAAIGIRGLEPCKSLATDLAEQLARLEETEQAARFGSDLINRVFSERLEQLVELAGKPYPTWGRAAAGYAERVVEAIRAGAREVYSNTPTPICVRPDGQEWHESMLRPEAGALAALANSDVWAAARPHLLKVPVVEWEMTTVVLRGIAAERNRPTVTVDHEPSKPVGVFLDAEQLTAALGLPADRAEAVEKKLKRCADQNEAARIPLEVSRKREPQFLYRIECVWPMLIELLPRWKEAS